MVGVQPEFELLANIVVSLVKRDLFAVFQEEIVVGLAALAATVGKVGRQEGKTETATYGDVGHGEFPSSDSGVIRVAGIIEQLNTREKRFEVRLKRGSFERKEVIEGVSEGSTVP
jgi:hypothetical protein